MTTCITTNVWINKYLNNIPTPKNADELNSIIYSYLSDNTNYTINDINDNETEYMLQINIIKEHIKDKNYISSIENNNIITLLELETKFIKILLKYTLQNKSLNYVFYIDYVLLLLNLSEILRKKMKQPLFIQNKTKYIKSVDTVFRCSYKFCPDACKCIKYYSNNSNRCMYNHYVHNMVSADLQSLHDYIQKKLDNNEFISSKEILKTINTLNFVTDHMLKEYKDYYNHQ